MSTSAFTSSAEREPTYRTRVQAEESHIRRVTQCKRDSPRSSTEETMRLSSQFPIDLHRPHIACTKRSNVAFESCSMSYRFAGVLYFSISANIEPALRDTLSSMNSERPYDAGAQAIAPGVSTSTPIPNTDAIVRTASSPSLVGFQYLLRPRQISGHTSRIVRSTRSSFRNKTTRRRQGIVNGWEWVLRPALAALGVNGLAEILRRILRGLCVHHEVKYSDSLVASRIHRRAVQLTPSGPCCTPCPYPHLF